MIKSAVGVLLFVYFLGSNAMEPVRPDFFGGPLVVFHREINRGMLRIVGPPIRATARYFGGPSEDSIPLRSTIAPGDEVAGERQS